MFSPLLRADLNNYVYQQNMLSIIQNTTRGALYKHLADNFTIQFYLQKSLNPT